MQFYVLRKQIGCETETEYEPYGNMNLGDPPLRCPECGEICSMKQWLPPYRVELQRYGSIFGDMIFGGGDILVNQSFVTAWTARSLKGLEPLYPVEVVSVRPRSLMKTLQRYYWVDIQPTKPRIDRARSAFSGTDPECLLCGYPAIINAIFTLRIDETSWSGEDIFVPWGAIEIIVTQKVVDLAQDYGLTNVTTIPIEEYRWDPLRLHGSAAGQIQ